MVSLLRSRRREDAKNAAHRKISTAGVTVAVERKKKFKFFVVWLLAVPALLSPFFLVFFLLAFGGSEIARHVLREFGTGRPDVAFFGDSVLRAVSSCEDEKDGIDDVLRNNVPFSVATISSAGFTPDQFSVLSELFETTGVRPRAAVVEVNIRSFSSAWGENPDWQFGSEMQYVRVLAGDWRSLPSFVAKSVLRSPEKLRRDFRDSEVSAAGMTFGTVASLAAQADGVPLSVECLDSSAPYDEALRAKFLMNYMYDLAPDARLLGSLETFLISLKQRDIAPLVYLTPINVEEGEALIGEVFQTTIARNTEVVSAVLRRHSIPYLDLTFDLPGGAFADKGCACEHLSASGRRYVGQRLAAAVKEVMAAPRE